MDGIHDLGLFVLSGLLLNVTPGADTLYIVARGTTQGARAGAVAALGIGAGCIVHTLAAALGLSAILATSATAFAIVKWIGAAYLVYLGLTLLGTRVPMATAAAPPPRPPRGLRVLDRLLGRPPRALGDAPCEPGLRPPRARVPLGRVFAQGFVTNVLNPKVALFFLAFLPQFIDVDAPHKAAAFLILGAIFNVNGTLWNLRGRLVIGRRRAAALGTRGRRKVATAVGRRPVHCARVATRLRRQGVAARVASRGPTPKARGASNHESPQAADRSA